MNAKSPPDRPRAKPENPREARLKAALKANMARRKAQLRARKGTGDTDKSS